jgi:hypothetical protein
MVARFGRPANSKCEERYLLVTACQARDLSSLLGNDNLEIFAGDDHGLVT